MIDHAQLANPNPVRGWRRWLRPPGKEWDPATRSWVREGWVAERTALMQGHMSDHDNWTGTCLLCNRPMREHPLSEH